MKRLLVVPLFFLGCVSEPELPPVQEEQQVSFSYKELLCAQLHEAHNPKRIYLGNNRFMDLRTRVKSDEEDFMSSCHVRLDIHEQSMKGRRSFYGED